MFEVTSVLIFQRIYECRVFLRIMNQIKQSPRSHHYLLMILVFILTTNLLFSRHSLRSFPSDNNKRALDEWRSSLYYRTMTLYKSTEIASRNQTEPQGHSRFNLFSPFVSCNDGRKVIRVGPLEDGMPYLLASFNVFGSKIDVNFYIASQGESFYAQMHF